MIALNLIKFHCDKVESLRFVASNLARKFVLKSDKFYLPGI
ncbi:hypothetical protein CSUNSWCD_889 [Campylobacter showae CSUNSWCD]|uniref:Uncharacterized protein n=1 Tax=Campylobacter showae CSUNSWCD TaxID=1244083 RepID=M5IP06_9BACT|nr:hypothetical protein CSUNSWCD_889 [Campylobacter showae CSUNSWCD]